MGTEKFKRISLNLALVVLFLKKYWLPLAVVFIFLFVMINSRQNQKFDDFEDNFSVPRQEEKTDFSAGSQTENENGEEKVSYLYFLNLLSESKIKKVLIKTDELSVETADGKEILVSFNDALEAGLVDILVKNKIVFYFEKQDKKETSAPIFYWLLVIAASWIFMTIFIRFLSRRFGRGMNADGNGGQGGPGDIARQFSKTATRKLSEKPKTTFADVAGIDEAKAELQEVVEFLKNPAKFTRLGAKLPKGVLLVGPPGCGKTLLSRAIAGEANVAFFTASGSEFVEMFVGVGASRVRDLFQNAKKEAPCIIFIDELDAMGKIRGAGIGGGHDEHQQTLNQILVEMDGIESSKGIIVLAATNRPDVLDSALLRPGRFDRHVVIPRPDVKGREEIFAVHTKKIVLGKDADLKKLAQETSGFTGADIENLSNEAAISATRKNKNAVEMEDFREAMDKITMGAERKSLRVSPHDKKITAVHEIGHALTGYILHKKEPRHADPLQKVSIIPRPAALGVTVQSPTEDRFLFSETFLRNRITVLLAGRAAEELFFDECTSGAAKDLEVATQIARDMVTRMGMDKKIGLAVFGGNDEHVFLGKQLGAGSQSNCSEETAREIDQAIGAIMQKGYQSAKKIIEKNLEHFNKIVERLLDKETLTAEEVRKIIEEL